jgi:tetratricopeptide (TPR) repeat protein
VGLRLWALGLVPPISNGHELTPKEYLLSVLALVGKYFEKVFLPIDLNAYYVFTPSRSWVEPFVLLGTILVILLLGVLLYARRWPASLRLSLFGAAWILLTLPPVLAIRQVGYNVFTERYLYLPSVGACLLLGALLWQLYSLRPMALRAAAVVASLLVLALFAVQTVRRNRDWKDELTLYQQTVKVSPTATVIHNGLGRVLFQRGEFQQAWAAHQAALAAEQRNYRQDTLFLADAYAGMGTVHLTLGQVGEAEKSFHQALDHAPHHDAYLNLGVIAFQRKDFETAYALSLRAVQVFPVYDLAYNNAGAALLALQRPQEAIPYLEQAVKLSPRYTQAQMNLAIAYQQTQQVPKAIEQLRAIVVREPDNQAAVRFLDSLLQSARPVPAQPP